MRWMNVLAWGAIGVVTVSAAVRAAAFNPKSVPADAKWVIHVDVDTAKSSKLWDVVDDRLQNNPDLERGIGQLEQITGLRFPQDFHDVTLYGRDSSEEAGVILCHADADQQRIISALQMNPDYSSSNYGNYEIHSWTDKGKTRFGAFHDKTLAIIARSEENVKSALDTLDGKAGALQADSPLVGGTAAGLIAYVAGENLAALWKAGGQPPPFVPLIDSVWLTVHEEGDREFVKANVVGKTPDAATQMRSILEGAKAMVTVTAANQSADPRLKAGAAALANLNSKVEDKTVTIDWPIALDQIQTFVDPMGHRENATTEPTH